MTTRGYPPTREGMREHAAEDAEIRVSVLLQAFSMPRISLEQIRTLLVDMVEKTYVSGFAAGWDAALACATDAIDSIEMFRVNPDR